MELTDDNAQAIAPCDRCEMLTKAMRACILVGEALLVCVDPVYVAEAKDASDVLERA